MKSVTSKKLIIILGGLFLLTVSLVSYKAIKQYFYFQSAENSESTLRLITAGLRGELSRYEPLPGLIADYAIIKALLATPDDKNLQAKVNNYLKRVQRDVSASDVYVMNTKATTIAASNFDTPISFINKNFSYRPYFHDAMKGRLGRYFALGSTSLKRGTFFSAPIKQDGRIIGVAVVKISVEEFEKNWRGDNTDVFVTDKHGIIFMSSQSEWLFKSLTKLPKQLLNEIEKSRQYPVDQIKPLTVTATRQLDQQTSLLNIQLENEVENYISRSSNMRSAGWIVHILTPTTTALTQSYLTVFSLCLLVLLLLLIFAFLAQRRKTLMDRIHSQREAQEQLEENVRERTADLNAANKQLTTEVEERILAEKQLRQTQQDLIQAGKLAALGQMSAALSHEFNQPLSAMRSYTDNANTYLTRGRVKEAEQNISRIAELTERMTAISKHLRNFARKPEEEVGPVPLATVINDAIEIMSGKLKIKSAIVDIQMPNEPLWVVGGQIRLQQVVVNLISNALDAMNDVTKAKIEISAERKLIDQDPWVLIHIRDFGDGFEPDILEQIFDPFFTTKTRTKGLGLGLSISYNIIKDFGGKVSAHNHPDGGAEFVIQLREAESKVEAAE